MSDGHTIAIGGWGFSPCPIHAGHPGSIAVRFELAKECPSCSTWGEREKEATDD